MEPTFALLTDESPMPQKGKYLGVKMKDIPVEHLQWLSDNDKMSRSVRAYWTDNREVLCRQAGVVRLAHHDRRGPDGEKLPFATTPVVQRRNFR